MTGIADLFLCLRMVNIFGLVLTLYWVVSMVSKKKRAGDWKIKSKSEF